MSPTRRVNKKNSSSNSKSNSQKRGMQIRTQQGNSIRNDLNRLRRLIRRI